jgi:hypothetical protein
VYNDRNERNERNERNATNASVMSASSISFTGFIISMMEIGFTLWQCMNEKIENSDSASAANVKITLHDGKLVIADDGKGMDEEEMKTCGKFHNRSSSSAAKHGTKGVGGNIADINLSGGGRVIYCSKSASSAASASDLTYYMELNYGVQTEEEYRPRPQEAPRSREEQIWNRYAIDPSRTGTVQVVENMPPKIYKELVESIKANDIVHSFRRIWAFTYVSILSSGKTIVFDVEGEQFTLHPIDMMKYNETEPRRRQIDRCSIYTKNGGDANSEELRVYYMNPTNGKLYYRDYSRSNKGTETEQKRGPEEDGYTKIGDFTITHTYNQKWRELHKEEMARNGIDVSSHCCNDQDFLNNSGGGVVTIARNRKHVCQFPTCQTGESASYIPYHQNSKHLLDYDASDTMDGLFNIQLNKSSLVRDNIQKEVMRTIHYLNRKFIGKMKTLTEKQEQEAVLAAAAASAAAVAAVTAVADENHHDDPSGSEQEEQSEDNTSSISSPGGGGGSEEQEEERVDDNEPRDDDGVLEPVVALPVSSSRVIHIPEHIRETIPQNHGIQILQTLKQQPQYHDAMADTVDTLLADCCRRISDERNGRLMTKRLINIGSFDNKCDLLCELLHGIYVLPDDTMRHGSELHRKYNAVAVAAAAVAGSD